MEEILLKTVGASGGVMGILFVAFIYFVGKRLERLEDIVDRMVRLDLLRLIASPHISKEARDAASDLLEETKQAKMRKGKFRDDLTG